MDRGAWWATVHRVTESQTRLRQLSTQHIKFKLFPTSNFYVSFVMEKGIDTYSRQEYWSG